MRYTLISYICIIKELDYCMIKAFKYRLNPTKGQKEQMDKTFGCCRYVYNWALDMRIKAYQGEKKSLTSVDLCKLLTTLKKEDETQWLNEVSNECLQQSIRCLDKAFTKFFREHSGFPKFKSKHRSKDAFKNINSVRFDFDNSLIKLPIIGWVRFYSNRRFDGQGVMSPSFTSVSATSDKTFSIRYPRGW